MIEGGIAGGSALQQAAQRRATADRLLAEAQWFDTVANDESAVARRLATLPPAYALLHDLRLAGSKGNVDHLVVGPGGAFAVTARRCSGEVTFRDDHLWVGDQPLDDVFTAADVEAQLLGRLLRTPVVAVVVLLDAVLPTTTPARIAQVMVCSDDVVARAISRGSHTSVPPQKLAEISDRALALLHHEGSVPREGSTLGMLAEPKPDQSVHPTLPANARRPLRAEFGERLHAGVKEPSGQSRSIRFVGAALVGMCALAIALGSVVSLVWRTNDFSSRPTSAAFSIAAADAPAVTFATTCPAPGDGWQLTPVWPGDMADLTRYEVDMRVPDGSWVGLPTIEAADAPWNALVGQPANATYTMRVTAVFADATRVSSEPTVIVAPAVEC